MKTILLLVSFSLMTFSKVFCQNVYINENAEKYHRIENCEELKKPVKSLLLKEALNSGYKPCDKCKPNTLDLNSNEAEKTESQNPSAGSSNSGSSSNTSSSSGSSNSTYNKSSSKSYSTSSVQCSARTKKGSRCQRMTTNSSGRCWQH